MIEMFVLMILYILMCHAESKKELPEWFGFFPESWY